jgi:DNA adenine methylase
MNKVFSLLNYVGHKSKLLDQILCHFPDEITGTFWDIFSGSCVVGLSTGCKNVSFVDNNEHLQNLYRNLQEDEFLDVLERMIDRYGLTNSSIKPRAEYLKDPRIGTCTWQGQTIKNLHLDMLNQPGYKKLLSDYNSNKLRNKLERACGYMILTLYGRNSNVSTKKDGSLTGGVGPLDFSKRAKSKYKNHLEVMKGRELSWTTDSFFNIKPKKDDFVYLDPPYLASGYKYAGWTDEDEANLLAWVDSLPCKWALSNVFVSGNSKNNLLIQWSKKYSVIHLDKNYRKWAAKGKQTAKRKNKKNQEVLILP